MIEEQRQSQPAEPTVSEPSGDRPIVGVRFKGRRVDLYELPVDFVLVPGRIVVVEADRGVDLGELLGVGAEEMVHRRDSRPRRILREATEEEIGQLELLRREDVTALATVRERVARFDLPMHMVDAEHQFDRNRVTFYFTAEHRVDFRELVRDLAGIFRTRIELRQIGTREAARRLGGIGPCGRECCCCSFLWDFERVTLQMARQQNLAINPSRLSGLCGRLLCCLTYEDAARNGCGCPARGAGSALAGGNGAANGAADDREGDP